MAVADLRRAVDDYFSPALQHAVLAGIDHGPMLLEFKAIADDPELEAGVARAVASTKLLAAVDATALGMMTRTEAVTVAAELAASGLKDEELSSALAAKVKEANGG
jgi:hypothetical protein